MVHIEIVKKNVLKSINLARKYAEGLVERDIDCDDLNQLTNVLSSTEEARSMALILTKLFPRDPSIEYIWKEATSVYDIGFKGKERFVMQCKCKNRKK